ncbi:hypothetical protein LCGC14_2965950, partial [marine sediment metagenome]
MNLQKFSERVVGNMDQNNVFDITILLMIAEILSMIVPIIQDWCNKTPKEIVENSKNPRFFHRVWL